MKTVNLNCEQCTYPFLVKWTRRNTARFCSMECANLFQSAHPYGRPKVPRIVKECLGCERKFSVLPSRLHRRFFCSESCQVKWRSRNTRGNLNPNWRGGSQSHDYPAGFFAIRNSILKRDGNSCASPLCRTDDTRVHVHHIDFDKQNCDESNLIAVCPSCNARANFNRDLWAGILGAFVRWRIAHGVLNIGLRGTVILNNPAAQRIKGEWKYEEIKP